MSGVSERRRIAQTGALARPGSRSARAALAAVSALGACALGIACGSAVAGRGPSGALPKAGSLRDDGSGLLYRLSARFELDGAGGGAAYGGKAYGGKAYGGKTYGKGGYGGARYAGYHFEPTYKPASAAPPPYAQGYVATEVKDGGVIAGTVFWPHPPRVAGATGPGRPGCENALEGDTFELDGRGRVKGAVVFLEDIRRGRPQAPAAYQYNRRLQTGGVLVRDRCRLEPRVQVVAPIGSVLATANLADGDHSLRASRRGLGGAPRGDSVDVRLQARGATHDVMLDKDGFYLFEAAAGADPARAWVVVAAHPYYVVTDEHGRFRLDEVPAGTYTLVVWHPPVVIGRGPGGGLRWAPPVIERRRVRVRAGRTARVNVELTR